MLSSQQFIQESWIGERMVSLESHLILLYNANSSASYSFSCHALTHRLNCVSASADIRVMHLHTSDKLHHRSWAQTNLPLLIRLSHGGYGLLSQCLHCYRTVSLSSEILCIPFLPCPFDCRQSKTPSPKYLICWCIDQIDSPEGSTGESGSRSGRVSWHPVMSRFLRKICCESSWRPNCAMLALSQRKHPWDNVTFNLLLSLPNQTSGNVRLDEGWVGDGSCARFGIYVRPTQVPDWELPKSDCRSPRWTDNVRLPFPLSAFWLFSLLQRNADMNGISRKLFQYNDDNSRHLEHLSGNQQSFYERDIENYNMEYTRIQKANKVLIGEIRDVLILCFGARKVGYNSLLSVELIASLLLIRPPFFPPKFWMCWRYAKWLSVHINLISIGMHSEISRRGCDRQIRECSPHQHFKWNDPVPPLRKPRPEGQTKPSSCENSRLFPIVLVVVAICFFENEWREEGGRKCMSSRRSIDFIEDPWELLLPAECTRKEHPRDADRYIDRKSVV